MPPPPPLPLPGRGRGAPPPLPGMRGRGIGAARPFTGKTRSSEFLTSAYTFWQGYGPAYPITPNDIVNRMYSFGVNTTEEDAKKMLGSFVGTESAEQVDYQTFISKYDRVVDQCEAQILEYSFSMMAGGQSSVSYESASAALYQLSSTNPAAHAAAIQDIGKDKKNFCSELGNIK